MDSWLVKCFIEASRNASFTSAADKLLITRQAMTESINRLERELGVRLFDRTRQGVSLTVAGDNFKDFAEHQVALWEKEIDELHALEANQTAVIRFGCNLAYLDRESMRIILEFEQGHPNTKVTVNHFPSHSLCWEAIRNGAIDIAMTINLTREYNELIYYSNGLDATYLCMSKKNPLSTRSSLRFPDDIRNEVFAVCAEEERLFHVKENLAVTSIIPSVNVLEKMLSENRCVVIMPDRQARDLVSDICTRVPIENFDPVYTCFVMLPDAGPLVVELAQKLSGSSIRRGAANPLPYSDGTIHKIDRNTSQVLSPRSEKK